MSDEQVKGIPEDLQSLYRLATLYPNDRYAYERTNNEVAALIERCSKSEAEHAREVMQHAVTKFKLARAEQALAALEARVAYLKVRGYLCPICEYPCLENVACLMCGLKARNQELESALERIASDFETDFVIDGQVVDEPYRTHEWAWRAARAALKGAS